MNFTKLKFFVYNNLVWIFLLFGVSTMWLSSIEWISSIYWREILEKLGLSIFSSGVFAAVLKSIQFTGIFKDEIEKVMLRTDFIKNRNDLPELWRKVTDAVYKNKFPEISQDLDSTILRTYLPTSQKYYYRDFRVTINLEEITDSYVVKYTQTTRRYVILADDVTEATIVSKLTLDHINDPALIENDIIYFKVDGVEIQPTTNDGSFENNTVTKTCSVVLKEKEKSEDLSEEDRRTFFVELKEKRSIPLEEDNTKLFRMTCITKEMDVSVSYTEEMKVTFFNIGLVNKFEKNHVEHSRTISRIHKKGIILPHQGFGLSIRKA